MSVKKKLGYIWDYYKLQLALIAICAVVIGTLLAHLLGKKNPVLYLGFVNVAPGNALTEYLTEGYLASSPNYGERDDVILYAGLYLTDDTSDPNYRYAYASEIKILASIEARKLDVVLMNRKALEAFSEQGYLMQLSYLLTDDNSVISSDLTDTGYGLSLRSVPLFRDAELSDEVFLGVLANTPRTDSAKSYLRYLLSA